MTQRRAQGAKPMQEMPDFGARPIDLARAVLNDPLHWLTNSALWRQFALLPVTFPIVVPRARCLHAVLAQPLNPATMRAALYDPDCGLRRIAENGVDFVGGHGGFGIAGCKNTDQGKVMFALWNWLKGNGLESFYPHRALGFQRAAPWLP